MNLNTEHLVSQSSSDLKAINNINRKLQFLKLAASFFI
jgi:hypothetical protein